MKLSVIIPVYNTAPYLRECLDSVAAQSFADWEAICVDDGSTDGSGAILDEYAANDSRFKVIHKRNEGVSVARNTALDVACGEWIAFVDSDDSIDRDWLANAVVLMSDKVDLVRLGFANGGDNPVKTTVARGAEAADWCWRVFSEFGYSFLCFIRRVCIGSVRFRCDVRFKEDMLFLLNVIPFVRGIAQGNFGGYVYRAVGCSAIRKSRPVSYSVAFLAACLDIWRSQREWATRLGILVIVRERLRFMADNDVLQWMERPGAGDSGEIRRAYRVLEREGALSPDYCASRVVLVWRWTRCFWLYRLAVKLAGFRAKLMTRSARP